MEVGRLFFPALRWDPARGFSGEDRRIDAALDRGVGGFILFGGDAPAVRALVDMLQARSRHPLLIGADLERGAGQQFAGSTPLPPPAALGWLGDPSLSRRAGEITAREARALGVPWVYAPVADVDLEPRNPIVGTRAFGSEPADVATHVAAWVEGCRAAGALACAKHFPGHGRTLTDSHLVLPRVDAPREALDADLLPFRRAIAAGVDSIMTAHVAYPALDPSGAPATLSRPIISELLRHELGFHGLVVTDALIMEGVLEAGAGEADAAVRALAAGCDALLYPADLEAVASGLERALGTALDPAQTAASIGRIDAAARRTAGRSDGASADAADRVWAADVARRAVHAVRGQPAGPRGAAVTLLKVEDDIGGPFPPGPRKAFPAALRAAGLDVREAAAADPDTPLLVALYADIRGWKGRPGISAAAVRAVGEAVAVRPDATIVLFGHPRLAAATPGRHLLAAWGGDALMQEAAAGWLAGQSVREPS